MHDEPWSHSNQMKLSSPGITWRRNNPMRVHHYAMRQLRVPACPASVVRPQIAIDVPAPVDELAADGGGDDHAGIRGPAAIAAVHEIIHPNCRGICTSRRTLLYMNLHVMPIPPA